MATAGSSLEQDGQTSANAEEENSQEDSTEEVLMAREYQRNIFNAYFLFKYKVSQKQPLNWEFGFLAYIILIFQFVALLLLTRLVMLQSEVKVAKDYRLQNEPIEHSFIAYPFFFISLLAGFHEMLCIGSDKALFRNEAAFSDRSWALLELRIFKWVEYLMAFFGILGYFVISTLYANHDWDGILNTILNLLAYQAILALDDYALTFAHNGLLNVLHRSEMNIDFDDVFKGQRTVGGKTPYITSDIDAFWLATSYSIVLQALYTKTRWLFFLALIPQIIRFAKGAPCLRVNE